MSEVCERIYAVVDRIPRGRVATYGQIAQMAGMPGHPRQIGYALNALASGSRVPWHRVINAGGKVSQRAEPLYEEIQRRLLEDEGIEFGANERVSLERYRWRGTGARRESRRC